MTTLVNSKTKISEKITSINGITNEMIKEYPSIDLVAQSFIDFIGKEKIIVAHNIEFDVKFLYANGINLFMRGRKFYDTLSIARARLKKYDEYKAEKAREKSDDYHDYDYEYDVDDYKLTTLLDYYDFFIPTAHRAFHDSLGTGLLFHSLLKETN